MRLRELFAAIDPISSSMTDLGLDRDETRSASQGLLNSRDGPLVGDTESSSRYLEMTSSSDL